MDRSRSGEAGDRTLEQLVNAQDLRSVITGELAGNPIDEEALRRSVWSYVDAERDRDDSPAHVIVALTELVNTSTITPTSARKDVMRRVILWCVEAYFGRLGGEAIGRNAPRESDQSPLPPVRVSNR